jgi:hypothetical protein
VQLLDRLVLEFKPLADATIRHALKDMKAPTALSATRVFTLARFLEKMTPILLQHSGKPTDIGEAMGVTGFRYFAKLLPTKHDGAINWPKIREELRQCDSHEKIGEFANKLRRRARRKLDTEKTHGPAKTHHVVETDATHVSHPPKGHRAAFKELSACTHTERLELRKLGTDAATQRRLAAAISGEDDDTGGCVLCGSPGHRTRFCFALTELIGHYRRRQGNDDGGHHRL